MQARIAPPVDIAIVTLSYNNESWCIRNLSSIACQTYPHFVLYYVNDCSKDNTAQIAQHAIERLGLQEKTVFINNSVRKGAMCNFYEVIHGIDPQKIVVVLDGDDWFAHSQVLQRIAEVYEDRRVWMTFGSFNYFPKGNPGCSRPIPRWVSKKNAFREYPWSSSHLRTFYAALFQCIKKEDFLYQGAFLPVSCDIAMMYPMLEMSAKGHYRFISEVLYIYNTSNPINDDKVNLKLQKQLHEMILKKSRYKPLKALPVW